MVSVCQRWKKKHSQIAIMIHPCNLYARPLFDSMSIFCYWCQGSIGYFFFCKLFSIITFFTPKRVHTKLSIVFFLQQTCTCNKIITNPYSDDCMFGFFSVHSKYMGLVKYVVQHLYQLRLCTTIICIAVGERRKKNFCLTGNRRELLRNVAQ